MPLLDKWQLAYSSIPKCLGSAMSANTNDLYEITISLKPHYITMLENNEQISPAVLIPDLQSADRRFPKENSKPFIFIEPTDTYLYRLHTISSHYVIPKS